MFDFLVSFVNEIRSYFVPEQVVYEVTGKCLQCGRCCNYMYSFDTYTEKEFKIMQFFFPTYRRFYIKGKDEEGNFIFACKLVTPTGNVLCTKDVLQCVESIQQNEFYILQSFMMAAGIRLM